MSLDVRPIGIWVVVEKIEEKEKKVGSIILAKPEKDEQKTVKAKVLSISNEVYAACRKEQKELGYKEGDTVVLHHQLGIKYDGWSKDDQKYWIKYDSPMGVIKCAD